VADERWLVTGASGQLGGHVVRQLRERLPAPAVLAFAGRGDMGTAGVDVVRCDLADLDGLRACAVDFCPTHVVHLAAMSAVADCHARPADARRVNVEATRVLAEAAAEVGAWLVYSSTDMVFGGDAAPYREEDPPHPLSEYGRSKAAAEAVLADFEHALTIRLPLMYGWPCTRRATTFVGQIEALRRGERLRLFADEFRTSVWLGDAARAVIGLARAGVGGCIHVAGPERLSRYELIASAARVLGIAQPKLEAISRCDVAAPEPRPADLSLAAERLEEWFPELVPGPMHAGVFEAA
jgi:dTDP-4-dehydrorhamnose reductase